MLCTNLSLVLAGLYVNYIIILLTQCVGILLSMVQASSSESADIPYGNRIKNE